MRTPSVCTVVTTFNGRGDAIECLRSLARGPYPAARILLMDDASSDGTAEVVRAGFPGVQVVRNERNLGYIPNLNRGIRLAMDAEYVLILNDDLVVAPDLLEQLVAVAESDPRIGLCGPEMYYYSRPRFLWAAGGRISPWTWRASHPAKGGQHNGHARPADVDYVPAAVMLVRTEALKCVGFFDPAFVAYFEDVDLCFRLRRSGYRVVCVPSASAWHKVGGTMSRVLTAGQRKFLSVRNRRWCMRRHASGLRRSGLQLVDALATAAQFVWALARQSPDEAGAVFRGYCAGWRTTSAPCGNGELSA